MTRFAYRWRKRYEGRTVSDAKRLKCLVDENARPKKLLAERDLDAYGGCAQVGAGEKSLSVAERRDVVNQLMTAGLSQRRSCALASIRRSCWAYAKQANADERILVLL